MGKKPVGRQEIERESMSCCLRGCLSRKRSCKGTAPRKRLVTLALSSGRNLPLRSVGEDRSLSCCPTPSFTFCNSLTHLQSTSCSKAQCSVFDSLYCDNTQWSYIACRNFDLYIRSPNAFSPIAICTSLCAKSTINGHSQGHTTSLLRDLYISIVMGGS